MQDFLAVERTRPALYMVYQRLPAIAVYLAAGFVPFLHSPNPEALGERWRGVYEALGRTVDASTWLRALPEYGL